MGHEPGPSDFIEEWKRAEAEASAARAARSRRLLTRVVARLALVAATGGVAWSARDGGVADWAAAVRNWSAPATESARTVTASAECEPSSAAWRRSCRRPGADANAGAACDAPAATWRTACKRPLADSALLGDGPVTTGSLEGQSRRRVASAPPAPDAKPEIVAQTEPAKPAEGKAEIARAWVDPDPTPAPSTAIAAAEPVEPVIDSATPLVLPPARPAVEALKPKIPERDARPKPGPRPQVAEADEPAEAAKPKIPERAARAKPAPRPHVAEAEAPPAPARRAGPPPAAKPVRAAEADPAEPAANRPLRRRTVAAAALREQAAEPRPRRLVLERAQEVTEMEIEIRPGQEPIVRRRSAPVWVLEGERTRARASRSNEFPAEFVEALRHYNGRYGAQVARELPW